jgi:uncharacterized protein (DUF58 family)
VGTAVTARCLWPRRLLKGASLLCPTAWAWGVAWNISSADLRHAVLYALGPLWLATAGALVVRVADGLLNGDRREDRLAPLDVLTESGCATAWLGALAVAISSWASLTMVGLLGLSAVHLVALWTMLVAGGQDPWQSESLTRRFVPSVVEEGSVVVEELTFASPRIPWGFRLFARGTIGPGWPLCRYVLDAASSRGEVVLERELRPARRGVHQAEPLEAWLGDVLGLCHSRQVRAAPSELTVLPRPRRVDIQRQYVTSGGNDDDPRHAQRLPTEGSMRLREYQPGDDARRIHWLRSIAAGDIIVRLPDELPPDLPGVRVVLDTYHPVLARARREDDGATCASPRDFLDVLVGVWLGVARSLAEAGVRVTLAAAAESDRSGDVVEWHKRLLLRSLAGKGSMQEALGVGARVEWQDKMPPGALLSTEKNRTLVVSFRLPSDERAEHEARWILVPAHQWVANIEAPLPASLGLLPHPMGATDNRWSRRGRERARRTKAIADHAVFTMEATPPGPQHRTGNLVARPLGDEGLWLETLS